MGSHSETVSQIETTPGRGLSHTETARTPPQCSHGFTTGETSGTQRSAARRTPNHPNDSRDGRRDVNGTDVAKQNNERLP